MSINKINVNFEEDGMNQPTGFCQNCRRPKIKNAEDEQKHAQNTQQNIIVFANYYRLSHLPALSESQAQHPSDNFVEE